MIFWWLKLLESLYGKIVEEKNPELIEDTKRFHQLFGMLL